MAMRRVMGTRRGGLGAGAAHLREETRVSAHQLSHCSEDLPRHLGSGVMPDAEDGRIAIEVTATGVAVADSGKASGCVAMVAHIRSTGPKQLRNSSAMR